MQKVQAVNADFSPYVDANANPTLHQMVTQMISDKVQVETNEEDHPVTDAAGARQLAGFDVQLLSARKDRPNSLSADRTRSTSPWIAHACRPSPPRRAIAELVLPQSLDGATVGVQVPRSVQVQYGTCPDRRERQPGCRGQHYRSHRRPRRNTATAFACARGRLPIVNMPSSLDVAGLAQIGLETAGMTPAQASDFLHTVDWKAVLTLSVQQLRN